MNSVTFKYLSSNIQVLYKNVSNLYKTSITYINGKIFYIYKGSIIFFSDVHN